MELPWVTFDFNINLAHVFTLGGAAYGYYLAQRKRSDEAKQQARDVVAAVQDMKRSMGTKLPPDGVLGDVESMKRLLRRHNDWLIELNAKADDPIRMERT